MRIVTTCGVASTRTFRISQTSAGLLFGIALLVSGQSRAVESLVTDPDFVDDQFEAYYLQPCLDGPITLQDKGWSSEEINTYNNAICAEVFDQGTFDSTDTYQSTSNIGALGAQSKTSDTVADQQTKSVEERLAEIKVEEPQDRRGGIGLLLAAQTGETERASTNKEVGYESDLDGVTAGLDYRFGDSLVAGFAVGLTTDDASFANGAGFLETESRSLMIYTTYVLNENAYFDAYAGFALLDYTTKRDVSVDGEPADDFGFTGTVAADFEGDQALAGASAGHDWLRGNYAYGVFGALDYRKTELDDYDERGNTGLELEYPDQESESLTIRIGVNGSYSIATTRGTVIPNISVSAVREEENDSRAFDARLVIMPDVDTTSLTLETDDPDRDYVLSSVGVVMAMHNANQIFVTYEALSSHDFLETWTISAGYLTEF